MGILNIFKNKNLFRSTQKNLVSRDARNKKIEEKKVEKEKTKKPVAEEKKVEIKGKIVLEGSSSALLINPYLSEKSTSLREQENKYIFKVSPRATKNEIKKLLENIYNVEVTKINVINTPAKPKRWRQKKRYFNRSKKMMVTIKKGQKIELGI